MAYAGYLIKLGGSSGTVLPLEFVKAESYDVESGRLTERVRQDVTGGRHRKITLEYYDPETDTYKTADGYIPVVKYPIRKLEQNMVIYNPIEFEFIEY